MHSWTVYKKSDENVRRFGRVHSGGVVTNLKKQYCSDENDWCNN